MILEKSLPWGKLSGKLSLTPEQANRMLGFEMKPGANGVVFQILRDGRQCVRSLMPYVWRPTNRVRARCRVFGILSKIVHEHMEDLIRPIWDPLSKGLPYAGCDLFMKYNVVRLNQARRKYKGRYSCNAGYSWRSLLISLGELSPPEIVFCRTRIRGGNIELVVRNPNNYDMCVYVFDVRDSKLYRIVPEVCGNKLRFANSFSLPVVYVYFKSGGKYSNSVSVLIRRNLKGV